ncbi:MAG: zf-TFIIB domain-containing protein [bacterium]|nr:zf-TFIIB domain-containing protein [Candidatus Sumerlaeota bacterium]
MISVCPRCDESLFILEFKDVQVDFCHKCKGVWLDAGELEQLLIRTGAESHDPVMGFQAEKGKAPRGRRQLCPRCDKPLHEVIVNGHHGGSVMIDQCPRDHGIWFDKQELQELLSLFSPESHAGRTIEFLNEILGQPSNKKK